MLDRIITNPDPVRAAGPCRTLAYGGIEGRASAGAQGARVAPRVGFVNAYGLTRNQFHHRGSHPGGPPRRARPSTIRHPQTAGVGRAAGARHRMQIRADGTVLGPDETGELFVRGDQVSGKVHRDRLGARREGWFPTKDVAYLDADGYLFIGGDPTTPSSAAVRTSLLPRSRTSSSNIRTCVTSPSSVSRTPSGTRSWWRRGAVAHITPDPGGPSCPCAPAPSGLTTPTAWCSATNCPPRPPAGAARQLADELKSPTA